MKTLRNSLPVMLVLTLVSVGTALAQRPEKPFMIEARGGIYLPTFDIADAAKAAPGFGASFGYMVTPKIMIFAEGDFGLHGPTSDLETAAGTDQIDINVFHYMAKVGYVVFQSADERLKILVNAGVGAMTFDIDIEGTSASETYIAINAGAKLYYMFADAFGFVLSPQGDIAFSKEEDAAGTSNSWVWPLTAGFFVNF